MAKPAVFVYIVVTEAYGEPDADGEEILRGGALAFSLLVGALFGERAARRATRKELAR